MRTRRHSRLREPEHEVAPERRISDRRSADRLLPLQVFNRRLSASVLSDRERQIAGLVVCGHPNKKIARICCISEQTVKDHLKHIYRKLEVPNRTALIAEMFDFNRPAD